MSKQQDLFNSDNEEIVVTTDHHTGRRLRIAACHGEPPTIRLYAIDAQGKPTGAGLRLTVGESATVIASLGLARARINSRGGAK